MKGWRQLGLLLSLSVESACLAPMDTELGDFQTAILVVATDLGPRAEAFDLSVAPPARTVGEGFDTELLLYRETVEQLSIAPGLLAAHANGEPFFAPARRLALTVDGSADLAPGESPLIGFGRYRDSQSCLKKAGQCLKPNAVGGASCEACEAPEVIGPRAIERANMPSFITDLDCGDAERDDSSEVLRCKAPPRQPPRARCADNEMQERDQATCVPFVCATTFPTFPPDVTPVVYVRQGGTGDGTETSPFGSIRQALTSSPAAIALAADSTFIENIVIQRDVQIAGACPGATVIIGEPDTGAVDFVIRNVANLQLRDLTLVGGDYSFWTSDVARLSNVIVRGSKVAAVGADSGGSLSIDHVRIKDVPTGLVIFSSTATVSDLVIEHTSHHGIVVTDDGGLIARELVIADADTEDGALGVGLHLANGGRANVQRSLFRNIGWAINGKEAGRSSFSHVDVEDTRDAAIGELPGNGIGFDNSELVKLDHVKVDRFAETGLSFLKTSIEAKRVWIDQSDAPSVDESVAVALTGCESSTVQGLWIQHINNIAVVVDDSRLSLSDVTLQLINTSTQTAAIGVWSSVIDASRLMLEDISGHAFSSQHSTVDATDLLLRRITSDKAVVGAFHVDHTNLSMRRVRLEDVRSKAITVRTSIAEIEDVMATESSPDERGFEHVVVGAESTMTLNRIESLDRSRCGLALLINSNTSGRDLALETSGACPDAPSFSVIEGDAAIDGLYLTHSGADGFLTAKARVDLDNADIRWSWNACISAQRSKLEVHHTSCTGSRNGFEIWDGTSAFLEHIRFDRLGVPRERDAAALVVDLSDTVLRHFSIEGSFDENDYPAIMMPGGSCVAQQGSIRGFRTLAELPREAFMSQYLRSVVTDGQGQLDFAK